MVKRHSGPKVTITHGKSSKTEVAQGMMKALVILRTPAREVYARGYLDGRKFQMILLKEPNTALAVRRLVGPSFWAAVSTILDATYEVLGEPMGLVRPRARARKRKKG